MTDELDEMKVFRDRNQASTSESAKGIMDEEKKAVVRELERDAGQPQEQMHGGNGSGFQPVQPHFGMMSSPCYPPMSYLQTQMQAQQLLNAQVMAQQAVMTAMMPSPNMMLMQQASMAAAAAMSPAFQAMHMLHNMMLASPGGQFQAQMAANASARQMPQQTAHLRHSQMNNVRYNPMSSPCYSPLSSRTSSTSTYRPVPEESKKPHIKKPPNAFFLYKKEERDKILQEEKFKDRPSADVCVEMGVRWQNLDPEVKKSYHDKAKELREEHKAMYPEWTARDNYNTIRKKKRTPREKNEEGGYIPGCRARYSMARQDMWCSACKKKKKCEYITDRSTSSVEPAESENSLRIGSEEDNHKEFDQESDCEEEMSDVDDINDDEEFRDDPAEVKKGLDEVSRMQEFM